MMPPHLCLCGGLLRSSLLRFVGCLCLVAMGAGCKTDDAKSPGPGAGDDGDATVDSPLFDVPEHARYTIEGLTCPVHVVRTEGNVPHIYAADRNDLAMGMGFVFAADRFFFLDLARRLALGEVSAFLGQDALETDVDARASGMTHVADTLLANLTTEQTAHLDAYAEGVNAYIDAVSAGELPAPGGGIDPATGVLAVGGSQGG